MVYAIVVIGILLLLQTALLTYMSTKLSVLKAEDPESDRLYKELSDANAHISHLYGEVKRLEHTTVHTTVSSYLQEYADKVAEDEEQQDQKLDFLTNTISDLAIRFSDLEDAVEVLSEATESDSEGSAVDTRLKTLETAVQTLERVAYSKAQENDPALLRMQARERLNQQRAAATQVLLADELPVQGVQMSEPTGDNQDQGVERVPDNVQPAIPEGLVEAPLKPVRGENDPLITDLRAAPFEESPDAVENMYDLTGVPGVEDMDAARRGRSSSRRQQRGFRRI